MDEPIQKLRTLLETSLADDAIRDEAFYLLQQMQHNSSVRYDLLLTAVSSVLYDLRTPLNSIIGFSRVLQKGIDGPLNDMQQHDVETIKQSGKTILHRVNDLLDFIRLETGQLALRFTTVNVNTFLYNHEQVLHRVVEEEGECTLKMYLTHDSPLLHCDEYRLRQTLLDILLHAVRGSGGRDIILTTRNSEDGSSRLHIDIKEVGRGVSQYEVAHFIQTGNIYDTLGWNGLAVAYRLTRLMSGELTIEAEPDKQTHYALSFPAYEYQG